MEINQTPSTSIPPGSHKHVDITFEEIESQIIKYITTQQPELLKVYDRYKVLNTSTFIRDAIKCLEDYYKGQNYESNNDKIIIAKLFEMVKSQLSILELFNDEKKSKEVLVLLFATTFLHIKNFLS